MASRGGSRSRSSTSSDANLLILDEPTNHLDLESREALEDALTAFGGTVLLISHDRALLEAVGSRTIVIEERLLRSHGGGWAEYRAEVDSARIERESAARRAKRGREASKPAGPSKNRLADAARLEREVEAAEAALQALEDELADPARWTDPHRAAESSARHERARRELDDLYARWERALGRVEDAGGSE